MFSDDDSFFSTDFQENPKLSMTVVWLASFHKNHTWLCMISKFYLWWSTGYIVKNNSLLSRYRLTTNNLQISCVAVRMNTTKLLISFVYIASNATTFKTFEILEQYLD